MEGRVRKESLKSFCQRTGMTPEEAYEDAQDNLIACVKRSDQLLKEADKTIRELRGLVSELSGEAAERLANDMDHANKDHALWYRCVKRARRVLASLPLLVVLAGCTTSFHGNGDSYRVTTIQGDTLMVRGDDLHLSKANGYVVFYQDDGVYDGRHVVAAYSDKIVRSVEAVSE